MSRTVTAVILLSITLVTSACVTKRPLISHAHIGHALTAWHDTPKNQGLMSVATQELDIAVVAARAASTAERDTSTVRRELRNALHALNPERQPYGAGLGYGATRALTGAIEHLEFAASSEDASSNFVSSVVTIAEISDSVIGRLRIVESIIEELGDAPDPADPRIRQVADMLASARHGNAAAAAPNKQATTLAGVAQIVAELDGMLTREINPAYQPAPRMYVLGLVRLPNGLWRFNLRRPDRGMGTYGMGY
jgi:hypothetical protein